MTALNNKCDYPESSRDLLRYFLRRSSGVQRRVGLLTSSSRRLRLKRAISSATLALVALILTVALATEPATASGKHVVVISPTNEPNYARMIRGVRSHFKRSGSVSLEVVVALDARERGVSLIDSVRALHPNLIITIGSGATRLIADSLPSVPVVFAGVLNPELSGFVGKISGVTRTDRIITGASLDIPAETQFKYFKRVAPNLKRLGLIYSAETAPLVPHARIVAAGQGIELFPVEVTPDSRGAYQRGVYAALDSLLPIVDGLWSLADGNIISPVSVKLIVQKTIRLKIPFMGFSARIVKSGALFALDFDYKDIGRQAAKLAEQTLTRGSKSRLPFTKPGVVWFNYNKKTADRLAIKIPEDLQAVAKEVYE